jgi:DNA-binding NtrC family response regulator
MPCPYYKRWDDRHICACLVVDDEAGICEGCRQALTPHGFEVEIAENALRSYASCVRGGLTCCCWTPYARHMSGLDVLLQARQLDPDLIGIITGCATAELAMQATREGAHDFITVDVLRQNMR